MKKVSLATTELRDLLATIWFVTIFYEVELRPRHAPQALQSTSKPDRPPSNSITNT